MLLLSRSNNTPPSVLISVKDLKNKIKLKKRRGGKKNDRHRAKVGG